MYIILKGKVACEVNKKEYDGLSICVAIKNDGDRFGELSHVDQDKLAQQINAVESFETFDVKRKFNTRTATCITVEETDLFVIDQKLSQVLLQPEKDKKKDKNAAKGEDKPKEQEELLNNNDETFDTTASKDQLSKRISMLQSIPYFADVDFSKLMPIAINIVPKFYSYGEFIIK